MAILPDDYSKSLRNYILVIAVISVVGVVGLAGSFSADLGNKMDNEPKLGNGSEGIINDQPSMYGVQESSLPSDLTFKEKAYGKSVVIDIQANVYSDQSFDKNFSEIVEDKRLKANLVYTDSSCEFWKACYSNLIDRSFVVNRNGDVKLGFYIPEKVIDKKKVSEMNVNGLGNKIRFVSDSWKVGGSKLSISGGSSPVNQINGVKFSNDYSVERRDYLKVSDTSNFGDQNSLPDYRIEGFIDKQHSFLRGKKWDRYINSSRFYAVAGDTVVGIGQINRSNKKWYVRSKFKLYIKDLRYRNQNLEFVFKPNDEVGTIRFDKFSWSMNDLIALNQTGGRYGFNDRILTDPDVHVEKSGYEYGIGIKDVVRTG